MASLNKQPNGGYAVQLVGTDGKRRTLRLGKVPKKSADSIKLRVESLHACATAGLPWDADLASWVSSLGDDLAAKIAGLGLLPARQSQTLGDFLEEYIDGHALTVKKSTVLKYRQTADDLVEFMGTTTDLRAVTPLMAERFKTHYLKLGHAAATISRRVKQAGTLFQAAFKRKLVPSNPFEGVRHKCVNPEENRQYVSVADIERVIAAANPKWQILIALARHAGLRCPSEVVSLRWEHVNFAAGRMTVRSDKTAHHGKGWRVVPIFKELRPHLERAFELAAEGAEYVVPGDYYAKFEATGRWEAVGLSSPFRKIVLRAGLEPWPRLFNNLRASKATDLANDFPIQAVTAWMGHTEKIALGHYLQVQDRHIEKAAGIDAPNDAKSGAECGAVGAEMVQFAVQSQADPSELEATDNPTNQGVPCVPVRSGLLNTRQKVAEEGLEPTRLLVGRF